MTEEQRSLMGYKSKVHEQGEFENPNEGKTPLTEFDEYILQLKSFPKVKSFQQVKEKKDGTRITVQVDKAICEFEDELHHNIVTAFFRVDSLNFSEDESFESAVIRFFRRIGAPLVEGIEPEWDRCFIVGMRFRGRVVIGKDAEKKPNGNYYLDIPTCRPLLQSDKHPEAVAATKGILPTEQPAIVSVENIRFILKGCATADDALIRLYETKQTVETIQKYLAAVKEGKITFPA